MLKFTILLLLFGFVHMQARNKAIATIPFEMVGSYIVMKVSIGNSGPLNFILDTGLRNTIVTELHEGQSIDIAINHERQLQGLGQGLAINSMISYNNVLNIGKLKLNNKTVYVLQDDIFNLSNKTGKKINGLMGFDIFSDHIVEINYTRSRIYFYSPTQFVAPQKYSVVPMIVERQKMFLELSVLETDASKRRIKMLIDTGAELTAWFQTLRPDAINIPEKRMHASIGHGLSGEIKGLLARVPQLCIANYCVKNPIVAFPDSSAIAQAIENTDRDGTIGARLLWRFNTIYDVPNKKFYFAPNARFNAPFKYNIAGIEIVQTNQVFRQYEIVNVWDHSPAEKAGVEIGDIIEEINFTALFDKEIENVRSYFENPANRALKMTVLRNGEKVFLEVDMNKRL